MPTIKKIEKKPKEQKPSDVQESEHKTLRKQLYGKTQWKKLRDVFIKEHPLCAECLRKGRVTASQDIHHKRSPFNYKDGTINWQLAYDENNLEALCKQCHQDIHNRKHASPEDILKSIEEIMKEIPD